MKYLRLVVVFVVLLVVTYVLYQCSAPSEDDPPAKPTDVPPPAATTPMPVVPALTPPKSAVAAPLAPPVVVAAQKAAPSAAVPTAKSIDYQPQPDLNGCIDQTLQLLEAKDVLSLVKTLMPPDAIQQMIASGRASSVDDIAVMYSARTDVDQQMTQLQQALESVKGQTPELNADGTQATYKVDGGYTGVGSANGSVVFIKVEGNWYLK